MIKKIKIYLVATSLFCIPAIQADWLTVLVQKLDGAATWDGQIAQDVLAKHIAENKEHIEHIKLKIKNNQNSGFWSNIHYGAYKIELATAKQQLSYHQKIAKSLQELPDNKKQREQLLKRLAELKELHKELQLLKAELGNAESISDKIKLGAQVAAKQTQISFKETTIKSSLLF